MHRFARSRSDVSDYKQAGLDQKLWYLSTVPVPVPLTALLDHDHDILYDIIYEDVLDKFTSSESESESESEMKLINNQPFFPGVI